ncbi:SEC-C domain-containing protein [Chitinophaga rhizophila]|uniref:SEC-C domain-containing protein n=1 Tax=Chitinophaga rhizophila TaxID=2866212 RepID=A0ABS7G7G4_9BACT|nr:SEC-C domain-containing protein [Chitinophaga rhizophila]MBW8683584.1 SEC-C domain-containing protein [Chitinophaga rhizophila]
MTNSIEITAPIQQLINRIGSEYAHEIIKVAPEPAAKPGNSYDNVQKKIASDGGSIVYGWAISSDEFTCGAEHYAVWEDRDGNLTDITPHHPAVDQLIFIPDDRYPYEGKHIAGIRMSTGANPLADHLILLSDMKDYILKYATRLDDERINFNTYTGNMFNHYNALLENVQLFIQEGGKLGSPCYCGSGKPYSKCHGKDLAAAIAIDKKNVAKVNE